MPRGSVVVLGALCGVAMGLVTPHASAQPPLYVPAPPNWTADGATSSMVLTPASTARLGIGVNVPKARVQVFGGLGEDVTPTPGVGYLVLGDHTGTLGDQTGVHMKLDRNDIQVSGPLPETVLSLNLQRYGGPVVVHSNRPMSQRVYVPFAGGLGVGTANPHLYAVSQNFMDPDWAHADSEIAVNGWLYSDISWSNEVRVMDRLRVGRRGYPGVAFDERASDALVMVGGKLSAQEIIVHVDQWADDVFDDDYTLPTLDEVEDFVREEHHLPGVHSDDFLGPSAPATGPTLLFEDDRDKAIVRPEPEPVLTLEEVSDRAREALAIEGVHVNLMSQDSEIIAGIRARWFFTGQGVTIQNVASNLVHVSVDFIGDDCHASVTRRPVEAGGSLAVKPIRAECEAEVAQMIVFNELGHPIHIVEVSAADRREMASG